MKRSIYLEKLFKRFPENREKYNYDKLPDEFLVQSKIEIECRKHGVFQNYGHGHLNGYGCRSCGIEKNSAAKRLTTEEFISRSKDKYGEKFSYSKTVLLDRSTKLTITCPTHGDFETYPRQHFIFRHGCPKCDYEIPRISKNKKLLELAKERHAGTYRYDNVPLGSNMVSKVEIICLNHGSFWQTLHDHVILGTRCPNCAKDEERLST